jgi:hypothetical protein
VTKPLPQDTTGQANDPTETERREHEDEEMPPRLVMLKSVHPDVERVGGVIDVTFSTCGSKKRWKVGEETRATVH